MKVSRAGAALRDDAPRRVRDAPREYRRAETDLIPSVRAPQLANAARLERKPCAAADEVAARAYVDQLRRGQDYTELAPTESVPGLELNEALPGAIDPRGASPTRAGRRRRGAGHDAQAPSRIIRQPWSPLVRSVPQAESYGSSFRNQSILREIVGKGDGDLHVPEYDPSYPSHQTRLDRDCRTPG
jgi:hypothetical protein